MRSIHPPRRGLRAVVIALVGVVAILAATVAPVTVGAVGTVTPEVAAPAAAAPVALPPTTAHGGGFQVRSALDPNFCIEVDPGTTDLRSVTLDLCSPGVAQRWTFSWLATGLNEMIEIQGMCVDLSGRKPGDGLAVRVTFCQDNKSERLTFTLAGQIEFAKGCLSFAAATAGAGVILEACDTTNPKQFWKLSQ